MEKEDWHRWTQALVDSGELTEDIGFSMTHFLVFGPWGPSRRAKEATARLLSQGLKHGEASLAACKGGAFLTSGLGTRIRPAQASGLGQRAVWPGD